MRIISRLLLPRSARRNRRSACETIDVENERRQNTLKKPHTHRTKKKKKHRPNRIIFYYRCSCNVRVTSYRHIPTLRVVR